MDRFSALAKEHLGWYVYLLRDPRTGETFWIGKGRGDRAFQHKAAAAASVDHPELQSAQAARINEIAGAGGRVSVDVLRQGIRSEPQACEWSLPQSSWSTRCHRVPSSTSCLATITLNAA